MDIPHLSEKLRLVRHTSKQCHLAHFYPLCEDSDRHCGEFTKSKRPLRYYFFILQSTETYLILSGSAYCGLLRRLWQTHQPQSASGIGSTKIRSWEKRKPGTLCTLSTTLQNLRLSSRQIFLEKLTSTTKLYLPCQPFVFVHCRILLVQVATISSTDQRL